MPASISHFIAYLVGVLTIILALYLISQKELSAKITGETLLEIKQTPERKKIAVAVSIVTAGLLLWHIVNYPQSLSMQFPRAYISILFFIGLLFSYLLYEKSHPHRLCTNGVVLVLKANGDYIAWQQIVSYQRESNDAFTLTIRYSEEKIETEIINHEQELAADIDQIMAEHIQPVDMLAEISEENIADNPADEDTENNQESTAENTID